MDDSNSNFNFKDTSVFDASSLTSAQRFQYESPETGNVTLESKPSRP